MMLQPIEPPGQGKKQYMFNRIQEEGENDTELNIIYRKTQATSGSMAGKV